MEEEAWLILKMHEVTNVNKTMYENLKHRHLERNGSEADSEDDIAKELERLMRQFEDMAGDRSLLL